MTRRQPRQNRPVFFILTLALISAVAYLLTSEAARTFRQQLPAGVPFSLASQSEARPQIKIGLIAPLTGSSSQTGREVRQAAELAVAEVNETGGLLINGQRYEVVLIARDSSANVRIAFQEAVDLAIYEDVVAIVGPPTSSTAVSVAQLLEELRVPMITPTASTPGVTANREYIFRMTVSDELQGAVLANFVSQELGIQRMAILYNEDSAYSQRLTEIFSQRFRETGGRIVISTTYGTGESNFTEQLEQIVDNGPEMIFLPNSTTNVITQIQQINDSGIQASLLGSDTWGALPSDELASTDLAFYSAIWEAWSTDEVAETFRATYQNRYNATANARISLTYDAFHLLFQAIETQGIPPTRNTVRQALANVSIYEGVSGTAVYQGSGDPLRDITLVQVENETQSVFQVIEPNVNAYTTP